jgi:hypothetical protein
MTGKNNFILLKEELDSKYEKIQGEIDCIDLFFKVSKYEKGKRKVYVEMKKYIDELRKGNYLKKR